MARTLQMHVAMVALSMPIVAAMAAPAAAQHDHSSSEHAASPTEMHMPMPAHHGHAASTSRDGSGTAWLPDSSPMHAFHLMTGGWRLMFHGQVHAGINAQGTGRGERELISTNWIMAMASHDVAGGELTLRGMLSLEPLTTGSDGYSLLLQSGEAYRGAPLVDRQHPHDLFMEVAARYRRPIGNGIALELYGGPVGEPALGPVAFPHRPSAMPNPLAPLSHHWLDSTHISFGVVTAGVGNRWAKLEGSWFNGREPDEHRYDVELRGFDSYATRLSIAPSRDVSLQASYGFVASPEQLEPEQSLQRVSSSGTYNRSIGMHGNWASTVAWGRNIPERGPSTNAVLVETAFDSGSWGGPFLRAEHVEKTGHDLDLGGAMDDEVFAVHALGAGYLYELPAVGDLRPGLGALGTVTYVGDRALIDRYGDSTLFAAMAYVTLRPARSTSMSH